MFAEVAILAVFVTTVFIVRWYNQAARYSIKHIRGPLRKSWLLGNIRDIGHQENVGDLDFAWVKEYGMAWRLSGPFASDILMVADPKALQHIFLKSGYSYTKTTQGFLNVKLLTGEGLSAVQSEYDHSRQRRAVNPAFSAPQLRSFLPLFRRSIAKMSQVWKDEVFSKSPEGAVLPLSKWVARATMDVIGEAAFDADFGALDDADNELVQAYDNLFVDMYLYPTKWNMLLRALWSCLPAPLLELVKYTPTRGYRRSRSMLGIVKRVSKQLVDEKAAALLEEGDKSRKDIMSVLVRANASDDPMTKLDDEEMIAQMATFIFAGHITTSTTLYWMFYELAKNPEFQEKLRTEISLKRAEVQARGDADFTMDDLESMPYLQATIKETLRFDTIVYHLEREAVKDDVIPLSVPIQTVTGETISEIPVAAGQPIVISVCAYNRLESIWGEDAHIWNPMRFVEGNTDREVKLGMFGNLMSFGAGLRGCIGWRLALIEMQAIVVELLENFKFTLPKEKVEIIRAPAVIMAPMVKGRAEEGTQMPLHVAPL